MITDIQFEEDGRLTGRLFGLWEISGEDIDGLRIAALEAFDTFCQDIKQEGRTLQEELRDAIDYTYSKDKTKWTE